MDLKDQELKLNSFKIFQLENSIKKIFLSYVYGPSLLQSSRRSPQRAHICIPCLTGGDRLVYIPWVKFIKIPHMLHEIIFFYGPLEQWEGSQSNPSYILAEILLFFRLIYVFKLRQVLKEPASPFSPFNDSLPEGRLCRRIQKNHFALFLFFIFLSFLVHL